MYSICLIFSFVAFGIPTKTLGFQANNQAISLILDAGHGLPDGGAVGVSGITEQELNLEFVLKLSQILNEHSVTHVLTRSDENGLHSGEGTIHAKKVSDIKKRIAIANENGNVLFLSVHMNSFTDPSVSGIQVFYSNGSKELAERMQDEFNRLIQPDNKKVSKEIPKSIYLFSHIDNPAILIECGFISNSEELHNLKSPDYQMKMMTIVADVLMEQS